MVKHQMGQHQGLLPNVGSLGQPCCSSPCLALIQICRPLTTPSHLAIPPMESGSSSTFPWLLLTGLFMLLALICIFFQQFYLFISISAANCCPPVSWLDNCISQAAASLLCLGICWLKRLAHPVWPYQLQLPLLLMRSTCWWAWSISLQSSSVKQGSGQQAGGL